MSLSTFISTLSHYTQTIEANYDDERVSCTYPDAQQAANGTIYLTWDFDRTRDQEILMTTFREDDVLNASDVATARVKANRWLVSKGDAE